MRVENSAWGLRLSPGPPESSGATGMAMIFRRCLRGRGMMSGPATSLVVTDSSDSWSVNIKDPVIRVGWALALERSLPLEN